MAAKAFLRLLELSSYGRFLDDILDNFSDAFVSPAPACNHALSSTSEYIKGS
jgi:hypothetical protein